MDEEPKDWQLNIEYKLRNTKSTSIDQHSATIKILDKNQKIILENNQSKNLKSLNSILFKNLLSKHNIQPWSAETPYLYTLIISHYSEAAELIESVTAKIGFRIVEIKGGQLLINDEPIYIRGVDRHEPIR